MNWEKYPTLYSMVKEWEEDSGYYVNEEFTDPGNFDMGVLETLALTLTPQQRRELMGDETMSVYLEWGRPDLLPLVEFAFNYFEEGNHDLAVYQSLYSPPNRSGT